MAEMFNSVQWRNADPNMAERSADVIRTLLQHGYEAYWVGGCVRDEYMGRRVSDMDITTSALPEVTCSVFPKVVPTGIKHGTVTVLMEGTAFEVTTYRVESGYEDHRHPTEVAFVRDVKEDLTRRDFTMNAMARGIDGSWVDPFGGREDIDKQVIRCVGDARLRFREDALRMVRCIRFASVFGFSIALHTWKGILSERDTLSWIAMERIRSEFEKIMTGPSPLRGLEMFLRSGLYSRMKAPFPYTGHDVPTMEAIHRTDPEHSSIRWSLLLLACGISAQEAERLLRSWTFSNKQREAIVKLLALHETYAQVNEEKEKEKQSGRLTWIKLVLAHGAEAAHSWLQMQTAMVWTGAATVSPAVMEQLEGWLQELQIRNLKDLNITGSELLLALDKRGGAWLGELLGELLEKAAAGLINNDKKSLINEAKRVVINNEGS
ncbi:CCA tRNA nucleotidyltransferase [Paenibacillus glucanolyticus]|uniref:CCA tRNA nucleotidyltransferase n=1 Tax=Paenibacillus glucanolyticus TaxID=59843 RepID=UPI00096E043B|nr:CCA tRNA nucleotidyltransferase [Paenibacillus glucanolyticus]OMF73143.1 [cytidine(C)-cytidine(C)-adenosine (A)]-adding enzyme [Paenibacillus glucanolyticus]